jgi:dTDP-4-dehydrorhamnose 3,5-epimerase
MNQIIRKEPNEFTEGPIDGLIVRDLDVYNDSRGWLLEIFRQDEITEDNFPVMAYLSETLPGVARGPHEHVHQTDYFAFIGPGEFTLYLWDIRDGSPSWGKCLQLTLGQSHRQSVIVPPGVVHAYKNSGDVPGWVFNAPNRLYAGNGKREEVDEIRHEDRTDSPYKMD